MSDERLPSGAHVPICFQFCEHLVDADTELRCAHPAHGADGFRVIATLDSAGHWDFSATGDRPDWCPACPTCGGSKGVPGRPQHPDDKAYTMPCPRCGGERHIDKKSGLRWSVALKKNAEDGGECIRTACPDCVAADGKRQEVGE